jgi:hypothetical protein
MRRLAGLAGGVVLLLAAVSCNTTQPADAGPQTFSVGVTSAARTGIYDIWEEWFDANGDGGINDVGTCSVSATACSDAMDCPAAETCVFEDIFLRYICSQTLAQDVLIPWRFSADISVVRKGATEEEMVATSVGTADEFSNLTPYTDGFFGVPGPVGNNPPIYYINGRRDAGGGRDYLGNCLGKVLDESNVLGQTPRFELTLNQGDTVVIRVRKQKLEDADPDFIPESLPTLTISGFLEGRVVSLQGNPDTTGDGGGTTQSFTLR